MVDPKNHKLSEYIQKNIEDKILELLAVYLDLENVPSSVIENLTNQKMDSVKKLKEIVQKKGFIENPPENEIKSGNLYFHQTGFDQNTEISTDKKFSSPPIENQKYALGGEPNSVNMHIDNGNYEPSNEFELADGDIAPPTGLSLTAEWEVNEPIDLRHPVEHKQAEYLQGNLGWKLIGASLRGKHHAHIGDYREDVFQILVEDNWHFAAIADGAGSADLARRGAELAVVGAHQGFTKKIAQNINYNNYNFDDEDVRQALIAGMMNARMKIVDEARIQNRKPREFSSTLLLIAHFENEIEHIIGAAQVGDGFIIMYNKNGNFELITKPDQGIYSGETEFLCSLNEQQIYDRINVKRCSIQELKYLIVMSDGVGDDLVPLEKNIPILVATLDDVIIAKQDSDKKLLNSIEYEKRGSFDDRTIVVLGK